MLIFGWRASPSVKATGNFDCPVCASNQPCAHLENRTWFTLFFIPIFPVSAANLRVVCGGCNSEFDPTQVFAGTDHAAHPASPVAEIGTTMNPDTKTSPLPVVSLVFGLLSFPMILACFASLFSSVIAIITGHLALAGIKRSGLQQSGRSLALTGLLSGYAALGVTIVLLVGVFRVDWSPRDQSVGSPTFAATPADRLQLAESKVFSNQDGVIGKGNSEQAARIAKGFAKKLKRTSDESFTGGRKRIFELSDGHFLTYCELHDDSCALVVHVPSYKDYKGDVREVLSALAWTIAVVETAEFLDEGDRLAVAMRGTLLYGDILIGIHPGDSELKPAEKGAQQDLYAFFPAPGKTTLQPSAPAELKKNAIASVPETSIDSNGKTEAAEGSVTPMKPKGSGPDNLSSSVSAARDPSITDSVPRQEPTIESLPNDSMPRSPYVVDSTVSRQPGTMRGGLSVTPPGAMAEPKSQPDRAAKPKSKIDPPPKTRSPAEKSASKFRNRIPVELVRTIDAKGWTIYDLVFLNDNRWLAAGRIDNTVTIFDVKTGEPLSVTNRIEDLGGIHALARSADGKHLLLGGQAGLTGAMSIDSQGRLGEFRALYRQSRKASVVMSSPAFTFMLSGGADGTLAWQPFDGRSSSPRISQELSREVLAAHLPLQGDRALATDGRELLEFSLQSGRMIRKHQLASRSSLAAAISMDGRHVAVSQGREIFEYNTGDGTLTQSFQFDRMGTQWHVAYHPGRPWLFSGGRGVVTVWDRTSAEPIAKLDTGTILYIKTTALTSDAKHIAVVPSSAGQSIKIFRVGD